uniref:Ankyrin repeat and kh domain-containing protein mask-like protein n=1 Tax=Triatoma infestans TaxID=30076 RepID=A0A161ME20_TRIIF
MEKEMKAGKKL